MVLLFNYFLNGQRQLVGTTIDLLIGQLQVGINQTDVVRGLLCPLFKQLMQQHVFLRLRQINAGLVPMHDSLLIVTMGKQANVLQFYARVCHNLLKYQHIMLPETLHCAGLKQGYRVFQTAGELLTVVINNQR